MTNRNLIEIFLRGECSDQELEQLHAWLSRPENREEAEELFKTVWKESSADQPLAHFDKEVLLEGILSTVNTLDKSKAGGRKRTDRAPQERPRKSRIPAGLRVALGLVIAFVVGYLLMPKEPEILQGNQNRIIREAPRGYRNAITLADGSMVVLNSESTIRYSDDYGLKDRLIYLEGEAFFEVAHNPKKPFIVIANGLKTTALGTSFNVNSYDDANQAISLATGKVKVEIANPQSRVEEGLNMLLSPGEQAIWNSEEAGFTKRTFDHDKILSWKDNVIYFRDTDLQHMISVLEKWYDVQINIQGNTSKLTQTGTGTFKNESLENVLSSLSYSMGFDYEMKDDSIKINLTDQ